MTERLLRATLELPSRVTSAGTRALIGRDMTSETAALVRANGGNADHFVARQLDGATLRDVDLVLALTREHRSAVLDLEPALLRRSFTLIEFARLIDAVGTRASSFDETVAVCAAHRSFARPDEPSSDDVIDPFGRDDSAYALTAGQIGRAVSTIATRLARSTS